MTAYIATYFLIGLIYGSVVFVLCARRWWTQFNAPKPLEFEGVCWALLGAVLAAAAWPVAMFAGVLWLAARAVTTRRA